MGLDDLLANGSGLNSASSLNNGSTALNGGEVNQLGDANGDWTRPPQAGSDQELQRSQTAVALNELLREHGLEGVGTDSLLLNDAGSSAVQLSEEVVPLTTPSELSPSRSLIVLDQGVANWRDLLVDAPADAEVLLIENSSSGVAQISDFLLQERIGGGRPFETLAIVCEGGDGRLQLGNGLLTISTLADQAEQIRSWGDALNNGADLLLFGSNVAASTDGAAFVQQLSALIGCDAAASDDRTGATALGGDLLLELQVGDVDSKINWLEQGISERLGYLQDLEGGITPQTDPGITDQIEDELLGATTSEDGRTLEQRLKQALTQAWEEIQSRATDAPTFQALLNTVYGSTNTDVNAFQAASTALISDLAIGDQLNLRFELETGAEMGNARGAYALVGDDGVATVYVNGNWLADASDELLQGTSKNHQDT